MVAISKAQNVIFKETSHEQLKADIYYPTGSGAYPGIVLIHGGAWLQGYKEMYDEWAPYLAKQGYVTMALDYRLSSPERPSYPEATKDVETAIQFFVQHAQKWHIDTNKIVTIGDSAGAHLASYIAIEQQINPAYHIAATIGIYGVYDLPSWQQYTRKTRDNDPVQQFMGPAASEEKYKDASPYYKINALETSFNTSFFIIWGDADEVVPANQSAAFSILLAQKGFDTQTLIIPGKGHYWFNIFKGIAGGSLGDDPNPLVIPNILHYLKLKLSNK